MSSVADRANVQDRGRQAEGVAELAKHFKEAVRGDVVDLAGEDDDIIDGTGHEKEVKRLGEQGVVQVPCPSYFRLNRRSPITAAHADEWRVLKLTLAHYAHVLLLGCNSLLRPSQAGSRP